MSKYKKIVYLALIVLVLFSIGSSVNPVVAEDSQDSSAMPSGTTIRVSIASDGTESNGTSWGRPYISADGRFIAFGSCANNLVSGDTNGFCDVFRHDIQTRETILVSVSSDGAQGNYHSYVSSISADGRFVVFSSEASNLVSGDTNNFCTLISPGNNGNCSDVFVHDAQTKETKRVSVASDGSQGNDSFGCINFSRTPGSIKLIIYVEGG